MLSAAVRERPFLFCWEGRRRLVGVFEERVSF